MFELLYTGSTVDGETWVVIVVDDVTLGLGRLLGVGKGFVGPKV